MGKAAASVLYRTAIVTAAVSLLLLGYALVNLSGGLIEVPQHWWSTMPVLGVAASIILAAVARSARRSTK
jgi:hypothetical protein